MRVGKLAHGVVAVCALTGLSACGSARARVFAQQAQIQVQSIAKQPVAGAAVYVNGALIMHTTPEGRASVQVHGYAGDKFHVAATCPEGFRLATADAEQEIFVVPGMSAATPELVFRCETTRRKATVAVRTENGPNLPIRYLGREIGRTDGRGLGTVVVEADQGDSFEIVVDTTAARRLHPQNPALTFTLGDKDESFLFDQKFTVEKVKAAAKRAPQVPVRIVTP